MRGLSWVGQSSLRYWLGRDIAEPIVKEATVAVAYSVIEERVE
jgi:hypothetical protein